ncbi:MerR family transcriptional regulator [Nonomuraea polychroma]|uniref:MerR family transcriptional regulator n=1 Tax=Nonomuraea polychroma TaxID=46176 RepID=UPI003D91C724
MSRPITLDEVLKRGLTYRQLDHWSRRGWLKPAHTGGTGNVRVWSQDELRIADLMRRLTRAGLTPEAAAVAARAHQEGRPLVRLGPGLVLAIDTDLLQDAP